MQHSPVDTVTGPSQVPLAGTSMSSSTKGTVISVHYVAWGWPVHTNWTGIWQLMTGIGPCTSAISATRHSLDKTILYLTRGPPADKWQLEHQVTRHYQSAEHSDQLTCTIDRQCQLFIHNSFSWEPETMVLLIAVPPLDVACIMKCQQK